MHAHVRCSVGQTASLDSSLSRQVLRPFPVAFSLLLFFGRSRFASAAVDLFSFWLALTKAETTGVHTPKYVAPTVAHAARLLEVAVRATAAAGKPPKPQPLLLKLQLASILTLP